MSNFQKLTLKDLQSLFNLKNWIRDKANLFHGKNIDKENMLIIINYLKEAIKQSDLENKSEWFDAIITLEKRIEVLEDEPRV